jgi:hypothetical protein
MLLLWLLLLWLLLLWLLLLWLLWMLLLLVNVRGCHRRPSFVCCTALLVPPKAV